MKKTKNQNPDLIGGYKPVKRGIAHDAKVEPGYWREVIADRGGFDPETKTWKPLKFKADTMELHEALDHITAAVEAGVVPHQWYKPKALFATAKHLEEFLSELESYDLCFRISDRWWDSLAALVGTVDEEGFVSCEEIAGELRAYIREYPAVVERQAFATKYFKKHPRVSAKLDGSLYMPLHQRNSELERQWRGLAARVEDPTVGIKGHFVNPYAVLDGNTLSYHEATADDVADLSAKNQASTKQVRKRGAKVAA